MFGWRSSKLFPIIFRHKNAIAKFTLPFSTSCKYSVQIYSDPFEAVKDISDKAKLLIGGYGLCGIPENLIKGVVKNGAKDLVCVSSDAAVDNCGLSLLLQKRQVKKLIASYVGGNSVFRKQYAQGEIDLELTPQGTLSERIRCGGAGIPAFYCPTGYGTLIQEGGLPTRYKKNGEIYEASSAKEVRVFNGINYVLEEAIVADFALIKAWKADKLGNLVFRYTAGNFNIPMCKAAKTTVVEVEELVDIGKLSPSEIHVPSIYCHRIVVGSNYEKDVEKLGMEFGEKANPILPAAKTREFIAKRVALEFKDGMYVSVGPGIPANSLKYLSKEVTVHLSTETGALCVTSCLNKKEADSDLIDSGRKAIKLLPGAAVYGSDEAYAQIRGGHIDLVVVGGLQVSETGDLANWLVPGNTIKGVGGLMDLVSSQATKVIVAMEHVTDGKPNIVNHCSLPLTAKNCVSRIITDMAVFDVDLVNGLTLIEVRDDLTVEDIIENTGCAFKVSSELQPMSNGSGCS